MINWPIKRRYVIGSHLASQRNIYFILSSFLFYPCDHFITVFFFSFPPLANNTEFVTQGNLLLPVNYNRRAARGQRTQMCNRLLPRHKNVSAWLDPCERVSARPPTFISLISFAILAAKHEFSSRQGVFRL